MEMLQICLCLDVNVKTESGQFDQVKIYICFHYQFSFQGLNYFFYIF